MDLPAPVGDSAQLTVAAARARLAELVVGQLYRVRITDVYPGKAEFLLGNQYLLATTPFRFRPGDMVTLKLIERTPELLTFQLMLPGAAEEGEGDIATLLRAANLADTAANRSVVATLIGARITVNVRTMGEIAALMSKLPPEMVAAFLPLYKELIEKGLRPEFAVLEQLARLSRGTPELAGLLAGALDGLRRERTERRGRRRLLQDAVEAALTSLEREEDLPTAQALKDKLRLLYGSPEKALRELLLSLGADEEERGSMQARVRAGGDKPTAEVELSDLANLALGERAPAGLALALNVLQALRIESSLFPGAQELALPLTIDGEPTEVTLSINLLAEQYYQRDYAVRVRVENETQGAVEFQLKTRGPGLSCDILAERAETVACYEEHLAQFREELAQGTGFYVRRLAVSPQSL